MENQSAREAEALQSFISDGTPEAVHARYAVLKRTAERADFGELDHNIVVIDTETTGFSFNHDELTQIAAARMERGEITDWFITFVNPGKPIPEDVAHLTDIHDEDVADAPSPSDALAQLADFVGDAKLVAHNAEFDRTFTTKHPTGYPLLQNTWIDSLDLARIALPRLKSHRLLDLVRAFDAPLSTHRADADVAATCMVFRILLAAVQAMPPALVQEIARMAPPDQWPTQVVFDYFATQYAQEAGEKQDEGKPEEQTEVQTEGHPEGQNSKQVEEQNSKQGEGLAHVNAQLDKTSGKNVSRETFRGGFSLRALRRDRLGKQEVRTKIDADDIAGDPNRELRFPTAEEITDAFSATGLVGALYNNFEPRNEQLEMAEAVRAAFASSDNLMVEAGTGVGKSMAYLVPAALTAQANNIAVGVATKTNTLLDQLVYHELPALAEVLTQAQIKAQSGAAGGSQETDSAEATEINAAYRTEIVGANTRNPIGSTEEEIGNPAQITGKNVVNSSDATETNTINPAKSNNDQNGNIIPRKLTFAPLKGFSHYPCLRRVDHAVSDGAQMKLVAGKEISQAPALAALLSFIEQTEYDDMDSLKIDYRSLPRRSITTTSADCLRRKCPYFGTSCFVHGSRRRAEAADIVVTNHSLLFCDLVADGGLLPPIRYWVVDEAHGAETEARRAFSLTLAAEDIMRLVNRVSADEASRNVFIRAERRVVAPDTGEGSTLFYALTSKARAAGKTYADAARLFTAHMKDLLFFDTNKRGKGYETVELWINDDIRASDTFARVAAFGKSMADAAEKLVTACQELVGYLEDLDGAAEVQREIASIAIELKDQLRAVEIILSQAPDIYAYSATMSRKNDRIAEKLDALLLNVGGAMNETLYARTHSVVFASATLAVDDRFDAFEGALGLNASEHSRCQACRLDSSYDFDNQMTVYVLDDMPEPSNLQYLPMLQKVLIGAHQAQQGSMLTLFTNRREMEKCFEVVQPALKEDDLRLVCQKWGVSVKGLRDDFLADEHLSLFALKSFWEGFDAPGATLKGVIIPKLPFAKPTDPLSCERAARDDQAWRRYVLPQAVLETKQAAGRLIRKADDSGVLILTDRRLLTKGYGKAFLNSLPSKTIKVVSSSTLIEELSRGL